MRFKIKEIGEEGLPIDLSVSAELVATVCPDLGAVPGPKGIHLRGQLLKTGEDLFLRGRLQGSLHGSCARCLEKAVVGLDLPVNVSFVPRPEDGPEPESEEEDDVDVVFFAGEELDLAPEIRDQILLAFPINPLCAADCAGICPVCGGNRNQIPCACVTQQGDPLKANPLAAALGKLKI
jgi:uncharacterized protein